MSARHPRVGMVRSALITSTTTHVTVSMDTQGCIVKQVSVIVSMDTQGYTVKQVSVLIELGWY